jgi:hypothetical protein
MVQLQLTSDAFAPYRTEYPMILLSRISTGLVHNSKSIIWPNCGECQLYLVHNTHSIIWPNCGECQLDLVHTTQSIIWSNCGECQLDLVHTTQSSIWSNCGECQVDLVHTTQGIIWPNCGECQLDLVHSTHSTMLDMRTGTINICTSLSFLSICGKKEFYFFPLSCKGKKVVLDSDAARKRLLKIREKGTK